MDYNADNEVNIRLIKQLKHLSSVRQIISENKMSSRADDAIFIW
jgi:hypothetical protein